MGKTSLRRVVDYCSRLLHPERFDDWESAYNGLQVENGGSVTRIAAAVDATLATVQMAVQAKADLLVVHHGLFWVTTQPWTGKRHELLSLLLNNNLAVYSSHLPLDAHPRLGNNAQLCRALGFKTLAPFFFERGQYLGFRVRKRMRRDELAQRLAGVLGRPPVLLPGGPAEVERIGVVSGGVGTHLKTAAEEGVDTFIAGEGPHWTYGLAEELGMNVFYGGHYATETFGVKALACELSRKFGLPWAFLDHPSGL